MRLRKFFKCLVLFTVLSLVYIHMQMGIIDLAYQGKSKEKTIRSLVEQNGHITYTILTLKSSNNLGIMMLAADSQMEFMHPDHIMSINGSEDLIDDNYSVAQANSPAKSSRLWNLLSFGGEAGAGIKK